MAVKLIERRFKKSDAMNANRLISEIPYNAEAKGQLFELLEDNDELML